MIVVPSYSRLVFLDWVTLGYRYHSPSKSRELLPQWQSITSQKTHTFMLLRLCHSLYYSEGRLLCRKFCQSVLLYDWLHAVWMHFSISFEHLFVLLGRKIAANCEKAPFTCQLISEFPAARDCRRGQVKFSVMHAGTHVWPHCGPTNCRLRSHLGLIVPQGTYIRVAEETR
jgi:hypothetical protein